MKTSLPEPVKRTRIPRLPDQKAELVFRGIRSAYDSEFSAPKADFVSYSCVIRDDSSNNLLISLVNMAVYELYLFAFGLPSTFPVDQIIIYSKRPNRYMPMHADRNSNSWKTLYLHCYRLTLPSNTEREEYRQRIINDVNAHFGLDVQLLCEQTVKDLPKKYTEKYQDFRISWQERLVLVIKEKGI